MPARWPERTGRRGPPSRDAPVPTGTALDSGPGPAPSERPNIVVVIVDDLRFDEFHSGPALPAQ